LILKLFGSIFVEQNLLENSSVGKTKMAEQRESGNNPSNKFAKKN